jgi:SNF2 family DNA or RNA helicase
MFDPVSTALQHCKLPFIGKLHDFQIEDITHACSSENFGFFTGIGCGKTTMSILTAVYKMAEEDYDMTYVLCPASLVAQWESVLKKMDLTVTAYAGSPAQRKKLDLNVKFLVMSFEIFRIDYEKLKDKKMFFIVDEATILCQPNNLLYKLLQGGQVTKTKTVPGQIKPVIERKTFKKLNRGCCLLTATPISSSPTDAFGLIKILNPDIYRNKTQFFRIHVAAENYFGAPTEFINLDLLKENLLLSASIRHSEDFIDLPPLVFKTIKYELSPAHMKLYKQLLSEKLIELDGKVMIDALQANRLYHALQRIILRPDIVGYEKTPVGLDILDSLVKSVGQHLIFANYTLTNEMIVNRYEIGGCFGGTTAAQKKSNIQEFKDGKLKAMAVHPRSGGAGLDLPNAQHEFFIELPITSSLMAQCIGRIHRQGQEKRCVITVLYAAGTIQETLVRRIMDKDDLTNEVTGSPRSLRRDLLSDVIQDTGPKTRAQLIKELKGEV